MNENSEIIYNLEENDFNQHIVALEQELLTLQTQKDDTYKRYKDLKNDIDERSKEFVGKIMNFSSENNFHSSSKTLAELVKARLLGKDIYRNAKEKYGIKLKELHSLVIKYQDYLRARNKSLENLKERENEKQKWLKELEKQRKRLETDIYQKSEQFIKASKTLVKLHNRDLTTSKDENLKWFFQLTNTLSENEKISGSAYLYLKQRIIANYSSTSVQDELKKLKIPCEDLNIILMELNDYKDAIFRLENDIILESDISVIDFVYECKKSIVNQKLDELLLKEQVIVANLSSLGLIDENLLRMKP